MNMSCANPNCTAELKYLRGGRLFLMERRPNLPHIASYDPLQPKRPVTMRRYFWLCESCAKSYAIQRWTEEGIELIPRAVEKRSPVPVNHANEWMPGLVG